jgi:hypothetical protein
MTDRYEGKPFLRLLDCYVLDAIGHLDEQQKQSLHAMEPKFSAVYNTTGSWQDIVAAQMNFPPELPSEIRRIWENGSAKWESLDKRRIRWNSRDSSSIRTFRTE